MHACFFSPCWKYIFISIFPPIIVKKKNAKFFKDVHKKPGFYFLKAIKQQSNVIQSNSFRRLCSLSLLHKTFCLFVRRHFTFN